MVANLRRKKEIQAKLDAMPKTIADYRVCTLTLLMGTRLLHPPLGPTVQPLRVEQPDAVCEVGESNHDRPYGHLALFPGGGQTEKVVH